MSQQTLHSDIQTTEPQEGSLAAQARAALEACGANVTPAGEGTRVVSRSPITGEVLAELTATPPEQVGDIIAAAERAFEDWRLVPAPARGAVIKRLAELLTEHKPDLALLVTLEAGKIPSESAGEVQEMIDICDLAVGLSRQLFGKTMPSERPLHRLQESWHPIGVVGVISAFNFPVAVWSWNTAIALVCGNTAVWKPSEKTPLTALASHALLQRALTEHGHDPAVSGLLLGAGEVGQELVDDARVALVSATGSTRMGQIVGPRVAARFGRTLLELGGNNAAVVTDSADLELATRAIVFGAAGTAGQRCTTQRRLIVHADVADALVERIRSAYAKLPIGDPRDTDNLVGPLVDADAFENQQRALAEVVEQGGEVLVGGGRRLAEQWPDAYYVEPALVTMPEQSEVVRHETFAPILYVLTYTEFAEAIALHNGVPQGLSSAIFTSDQAEAERFLAADGADCGIVNVNAGTSGAEIGGAFGGEKQTGGGRESGSDAWRAYMRRTTTTINYSGESALAQGVNFL